VKRAVTIPQGFVVRDRSGPKAVARSERFGFELEEAAVRTAARFGARPRGVRCPAAVFACRLTREWVAVAHVADLPGDGPDPPLGFWFLALHAQIARPVLQTVGGVFGPADAFPPDWTARGQLPEPELAVPAEAGRPVEALQRLLKAGDSSLLLGGAQALLDGSKVLIESPVPDPETVRGVWQLLPDAARAGLYPATFAFGNELGFDLVVVPPDGGVEPRRWPGYLTADQARDYPEGRYELALQTAVEAGDQREVDRLFARRTSQETLRLAAAMVGLAVLVAVVVKVLFGG
jgi:hypothetical protein